MKLHLHVRQIKPWNYNTSNGKNQGKSQGKENVRGSKE